MRWWVLGFSCAVCCVAAGVALLMWGCGADAGGTDFWGGSKEAQKACGRWPMLAYGYVESYSEEDRDAFLLDEGKAFVVMHADGGEGRCDLGSVRIDESGNVRLIRTGVVMQVARLRVDAGAVKKVVDSIKRNKVLALERDYFDEKIADGTQWSLMIRQGEQTKRVSLSNRFPSGAVRFANDLYDAVGFDRVPESQWEKVDEGTERELEKERAEQWVR